VYAPTGWFIVAGRLTASFTPSKLSALEICAFPEKAKMNIDAINTSVFSNFIFLI
jgi:hypothetical protein